MQMFSMGGMSYVAYTLDKVLQAYCNHGGENGAAVTEADLARCRAATEAAPRVEQPREAVRARGLACPGVDKLLR